MRSPVVVSMLNQWRRRYISPRSGVLDFHLRRTWRTEEGLLRQVNWLGRPGSPRDMAEASKGPGVGRMGSLMNCSLEESVLMGPSSAIRRLREYAAPRRSAVRCFGALLAPRRGLGFPLAGGGRTRAAAGFPASFTRSAS